MAKPEEFTIHIEPDGRILVEGRTLQEMPYRRLAEWLEETVGPVHHIDFEAGDPPRAHVRPASDQQLADEPKRIHIRNRPKKS